MRPMLRCCNDTYARGDDGVWRYAWGEPVPGAQDLTLELARQLALVEDDDSAAPLAGGDTDAPLERGGTSAPLAGGDTAAPLESEDVARILESYGLEEPLVLEPGHPESAVLGLLAPELTASALLTVSDVGELAGVSKATIDSYRYRGYLPEPQFVKVRTPLWTRPVIRHWLLQRPGCGWRTDIYGERSSATVTRRMPITRARRARAGRATA